MEGILMMSQKEIDRIKILIQTEKKELTVEATSKLLKISKRQVYRILKRIKLEGTRGIVHKSRGKKSNRGYPEEVKEKVMKIYRKEYNDYGATLYSEELIKRHQIAVNHETIRRWMRERGITTSMRKKRGHRKRRERRTGYGEMLQFDGSHHDWFEGRGSECCLFVCVDDATGRVYMRFARSENSADAMSIMWEYIERHGIPRSLYLDRAATYYAEKALTDFGRAMKELNCELIYAHSPQGKGRVENRNRTLQDRLVKELRKREISTMAEANKYLRDEFIEEFNSKFEVNRESVDVHREIEGYRLENIFCYKTTRQVRNDYTINLGGGYVQLLKGEAPLPKPRQDVFLSYWLDDSLHIYYNEQELSYKVLKDKPRKKVIRINKPGKNHPWRIMNSILPGNKKNILPVLG